MKTRRHPLALAALLLAPSLAFAAVFEGKVAMKMTDQRGAAQVVNFSLKNGLQRIDLEAEQGMPVATILNLAQHEMLILMPAQSMYMVQKIPDVAAGHAGGPGGEGTLEKTAVTEKILGYDCVKYVAKGKDSVTEMWVTDQLGQFMGLGGGNPMAGGPRGAPAGWEKAMMGKDFFPLRVIETGGNGKIRTRLEVISVDKQALSAALFTPPAGWQKFDLSGMMQGIMPGVPR